MKKNTSLFPLALCLLAGSAQGAIIAWDDFNYSSGQSFSTEGSTTLNGGAGFTTAWRVRQQGTGTVQTSANGLLMTPATNNVYAARGFSTLTTGTYYLTWTAENTNAGTRFLAFSLVYAADPSTPEIGGTGGGEQTYIGQGGNQSVWSILSAIDATSSATYPSTDFNSRDTDPTLFVLKLELNGTGTSNLSLFINPDLNSAEPLTPHITATDTYTNGINAIWMGSGFNSGSQTTVISEFGNLGITTTWADLSNIPEPSSITFVLLGLSLCARRKR